MQVRFQETPWDLYVALGYTLATAAFLLAVDVGSLVASLLVLFVPGYVLAAVLFPSADEIDWIERIALNFGLSVAIVPGLALILNFTAFGIRFGSVVATIALFTFAVGLAAVWRRRRLAVEKRLTATVDLKLPDWSEYSGLDRALTLGLAAAIVVAGCTLGFVLMTPGPGERFTEFYILGPGGNASGYPATLNASQPGSVIIGIANHESISVNYTARIDLVGVRIVYNSTSGFNETTEVNRTTWSTLSVTLADGRNWTELYLFQINYVGMWKVQFLLYKDGDFSTAYRGLHLYVTVT